MQGTTQQKGIAKTLNFQQAGEFFRALDAQNQDDLIANLSADLAQVKNKRTQEAMLAHFYKADAQYGARLAKALGVDVALVHQRATSLLE